jgi:hypothetical protein
VTIAVSDERLRSTAFHPLAGQLGVIVVNDHTGELSSGRPPRATFTGPEYSRICPLEEPLAQLGVRHVLHD